MGRKPFHLLLISLFLSACSIENASYPKEQSLTIASNFLQEEDSLIFNDFAENYNVNVRLLELSTDEILNHIESRGINSEIDVVLLNSTYDAFLLKKAKVTQHVEWGELSVDISKKYYSTEFDFIGVAINPYIFVNPSKGNPINMYDELQRTPFISSLSEKKTVPFVAPFYKKLRKIEANEWVSNYSKNSTGIMNDSLSIFCMYSEYQQKVMTDSAFMNRSIQFPNKRSSGTIYDLFTISIVHQTSNYQEAIDLVKYISNTTLNQDFASSFNGLSVNDTESPYRFYSSNINDICQFYTSVKRILDKY